MTDCKLIGQWRIIKSDNWDNDYLDLCGPAMMKIGDDGHGEIAFGALETGLSISYSQTMIFFIWEGYDKMDEVNGSGSAELMENGTMEIEFNFHNSDETILIAKRATFSAAC